MNLTKKQIDILASIADHEMWTGDIAESVGLQFYQMENVRHALNKLIALGLATSRRQSEVMGRRILYVATDAGRNALSVYRAFVAQHGSDSSKER